MEKRSVIINCHGDGDARVLAGAFRSVCVEHRLTAGKLQPCAEGKTGNFVFEVSGTPDDFDTLHSVAEEWARAKHGATINIPFAEEAVARL